MFWVKFQAKTWKNTKFKSKKENDIKENRLFWELAIQELRKSIKDTNHTHQEHNQEAHQKLQQFGQQVLQQLVAFLGT